MRRFILAIFLTAMSSIPSGNLLAHDKDWKDRGHGKHKGWEARDRDHDRFHDDQRRSHDNYHDDDDDYDYDDDHYYNTRPNRFDSSYRGNAMMRRCPFSCGGEGFDKSGCKDWREGDMCFVELTGNNRNPSGQTAWNRGRGVQGRSCPFSCATQGIPKSQCKDWREGNTCYIHDLRR